MKTLRILCLCLLSFLLLGATLLCPSGSTFLDHAVFSSFPALSAGLLLPPLLLRLAAPAAVYRPKTAMKALLSHSACFTGALGLLEAYEDVPECLRGIFQGLCAERPVALPDDTQNLLKKHPVISIEDLMVLGYLGGAALLMTMVPRSKRNLLLLLYWIATLGWMVGTLAYGIVDQLPVLESLPGGIIGFTAAVAAGELVREDVKRSVGEYGVEMERAVLFGREEAEEAERVEIV